MRIGLKFSGDKDVCYTWRCLSKDGFDKNEIFYVRELFLFSRILSLNKDFVKLLGQLRKKYKFDRLPKDFQATDYWDFRETDPNLYKWFDETSVKAANIILKNFVIDSRWAYLIKYLVIVGYLAVGSDFYWHNAEWYKERDTFVIRIFHPVSKNYLHRLVDSIWKHSKKEITHLPKFNIVNISERDLRIVELRDKNNMKYADIATQIQKEFRLDNSEGSINEDSIKTAYKRARSKIYSINKK